MTACIDFITDNFDKVQIATNALVASSVPKQVQGMFDAHNAAAKKDEDKLPFTLTDFLVLLRQKRSFHFGVTQLASKRFQHMNTAAVSCSARITTSAR